MSVVIGENVLFSIFRFAFVLLLFVFLLSKFMRTHCRAAVVYAHASAHTYARAHAPDTYYFIGV